MRVTAAPRILPQVPSVGSALASRGVGKLMWLALTSAKPAVTWRRDRPLVELKNAHRTNTVDQMKAALTGRFSQLECDVRGAINAPHELECRHDTGSEPGDNLTLKEWLTIGKASGRVLKLDVKDSNRLGDILAAVEASGVPPERLNINLGDAAMRSWGDELRRRLPGALLSLNPRGALNDLEVKSLTALAQHLGPPCTFVVRNDLLTDAAIRALEMVAPVSVWNDPGMKGIDYPEQATEALKDRGCTGVIDIRASATSSEKVGGFLSHLGSLIKDLFLRL